MNKKLWRIEKEIKSLVLRITLVSKQIEMRDKWTLGSHTIRVLSVSRFFSVKRRWWVFTITNIFEGCLWIQCESIQSPCSASLDFIERYHNRVFAYYLMKKFTTEYCATWKILQKYCITIWKKIWLIFILVYLCYTSILHWVNSIYYRDIPKEMLKRSF